MSATETTPLCRTVGEQISATGTTPPLGRTVAETGSAPESAPSYRSVSLQCQNCDETLGTREGAETREPACEDELAREPLSPLTEAGCAASPRHSLWEHAAAVCSTLRRQERTKSLCVQVAPQHPISKFATTNLTEQSHRHPLSATAPPSPHLQAPAWEKTKHILALYPFSKGIDSNRLSRGPCP